MNTSTIQMTPVPYWIAQAHYARSVCVDLMHKLVRQRKRTRSQVQSDYDGGEWKEFMEARSWEKSSSLDDFVLGSSRNVLHAQIDGRLHTLSSRDYYRYRTQQIVALLSEFDQGSPKLVEVGCGAGRNLYAAATSGRWRELRGLELSRTGIEVVQQVAAHFKLDGVSAGAIDLLDESSPGFAELLGGTVFTFYCLEQLPSYTEAVLRRMAAAGVRRVVHIEPTMELFSATSLRDLASMAYIWRQNYLADLVNVARRLEDQGLIRVIATRRLGFAPTLRNTPTLVVWEPVQQAG